MSKTRVAIIEDDGDLRRVLTQALATDAEFEVVDSGPISRGAVTRSQQVAPDLVLLGLGKPKMTGLAILVALRQRFERLPILMLIQPADQGSSTTMEALAAGASDFVLVPGSASIARAPGSACDPLVTKLRLFRKQPGRDATPTVKPLPTLGPGPQLVPPAEIVAFGASTGGPNALAEVLSALHPDLPVPVVAVQHMPPLFTRMLAERLVAQTGFTVHEAADGQILYPGEIWLAPGDRHLTLVHDGLKVRLKTHQGPPENSCRPSVDVLLRSAVEVYRSGVLAVILTGMGQDGLRGCEQVRSTGGQILVQDEASSVVWGMPGFVARAGLADEILPLGQIGAAIDSRVRHSRSRYGPGLRLARDAQEGR
jgi:two-component system chemotaxis response regulator CheB